MFVWSRVSGKKQHNDKGWWDWCEPDVGLVVGFVVDEAPPHNNVLDQHHHQQSTATTTRRQCANSGKMDYRYIFSAEQIEVPKDLPSIMKAWTKEVVRYNPQNVLRFSKEYFEAMHQGADELERFLARHEQLKNKPKQQVSRSRRASMPGPAVQAPFYKKDVLTAGEGMTITKSTGALTGHGSISGITHPIRGVDSAPMVSPQVTQLIILIVVIFTSHPRIHLLSISLLSILSILSTYLHLRIDHALHTLLCHHTGSQACHLQEGLR